MYIKSTILYFATLLCFTACAPEPTVTLNKEDRKHIDSLYKKVVPQLQLETDSICELEQQKIMDRAVDSIILERLEERKKRLGY